MPKHRGRVIDNSRKIQTLKNLRNIGAIDAMSSNTKRRATPPPIPKPREVSPRTIKRHTKKKVESAIAAAEAGFKFGSRGKDARVTMKQGIDERAKAIVRRELTEKAEQSE